MNILLVEDDLETALFIEKTMREYQHIVHREDNGFKGYKNVLEGNYGVIIVDRMLPRLDGLEMIKKLREQNNHTPVLILSALDKVNEIVEGLRAGADDYLAKPFSFVELLARIEALIRRQPVRKNSRPKMVLANLVLDRFSRGVYRDDSLVSPRNFLLESSTRKDLRAM